MQCRLPHKSIKNLSDITMTITNSLGDSHSYYSPYATIKISDTTYNTATAVIIPAKSEIIATIFPLRFATNSKVSITLNGTTVATNAKTSSTGKPTYKSSATYTFNATANFTVTLDNSSLAIVMPA